jgi:PIN domain nuclease of toxin-antitoxin system
MTELPISSTHAILAGQLPKVHRDPFDRMLVAQSRLEECPLITDDPVFKKYQAQVVW